ncbi:MAG: hypothetical protein ABIQ99_17810 [Thermoflexales bacterium]
MNVERTLSPAALGVGDSALGFANCKATIDFSAGGYLGLLGWVQLVRSTDNTTHGRQFEMDPFDPFELYERAPLPYCWYGIAPTLFDAPSRDERVQLDWVAHSFLGASPFGGNTRVVAPLLGFSWGFAISDDKRIRLKPITILDASDWQAHLPYLRECYPEWQFAETMTPAN